MKPKQSRAACNLDANSLKLHQTVQKILIRQFLQALPRTLLPIGTGQLCPLPHRLPDVGHPIAQTAAFFPFLFPGTPFISAFPAPEPQQLFLGRKRKDILPVKGSQKITRHTAELFYTGLNSRYVFPL